MGRFRTCVSHADRAKLIALDLCALPLHAIRRRLIQPRLLSRNPPGVAERFVCSMLDWVELAEWHTHRKYSL